MKISLILQGWIRETLKLDSPLVLAHPKEMKNGDFTLIANDFDAKEAFEKLSINKIPEVERVDFVVPRFINIFLSKNFFAQSIAEINKQDFGWGSGDLYKNQKIIVEHTQPNPFKEFHIGHLMNNVIGESVARILKANNADVKTCSYHGDVGLHIAKTIFGMVASKGNEELIIRLDKTGAPLDKKMEAVGMCYVYGSHRYENEEEVRGKIIQINKQVYDKSNTLINHYYDLVKKWSLEYFESIYEKLDSYFDHHFYESETGEIGKELVVSNLAKIFEESEGAVVFRGENFEPKTHTRVFLNKDGLPTYEAKELGLAKIKMVKFGDYDQSITVTANEQDSFFDVVEVAIGKIFPKLEGKLKHLSHGILRLPSGKMSSRTGDVITAESLINQIKEKVLEKIKEREFSAEEKENIAEMVAVGAIKYSILRQAIGGDIIFDFEKSISFEGDSGPYLQYTAVRAKSVLEKAKSFFQSHPERPENFGITEVERLLYRFPEVVERAGKEYAPHHLVTYLTELASSFNSFYGNEKIIDNLNPNSSYKIILTRAVYITLKNGLKLLAIKIPDKM